MKRIISKSVQMFAGLLAVLTLASCGADPALPDGVRDVGEGVGVVSGETPDGSAPDNGSSGAVDRLPTDEGQPQNPDVEAVLPSGGNEQDETPDTVIVNGVEVRKATCDDIMSWMDGLIDGEFEGNFDPESPDRYSYIANLLSGGTVEVVERYGYYYGTDFRYVLSDYDIEDQGLDAELPESEPTDGENEDNDKPAPTPEPVNRISDAVRPCVEAYIGRPLTSREFDGLASAILAVERGSELGYVEALNPFARVYTFYTDGVITVQVS